MPKVVRRILLDVVLARVRMLSSEIDVVDDSSRRHPIDAACEALGFAVAVRDVKNGNRKARQGRFYFVHQAFAQLGIKA